MLKKVSWITELMDEFWSKWAQSSARECPWMDGAAILSVRSTTTLRRSILAQAWCPHTHGVSSKFTVLSQAWKNVQGTKCSLLTTGSLTPSNVNLLNTQPYRFESLFSTVRVHSHLLCVTWQMAGQISLGHPDSVWRGVCKTQRNGIRTCGWRYHNGQNQKYLATNPPQMVDSMICMHGWVGGWMDVCIYIYAWLWGILQQCQTLGSTRNYLENCWKAVRQSGDPIPSRPVVLVWIGNRHNSWAVEQCPQVNPTPLAFMTHLWEYWRLFVCHITPISRIIII